MKKSFVGLVLALGQPVATSYKEHCLWFLTGGSGRTELEGASAHAKLIYVELHISQTSYFSSLVWTVNQCFCLYEVPWKIKLQSHKKNLKMFCTFREEKDWFQLVEQRILVEKAYLNWGLIVGTRTGDEARKEEQVSWRSKRTHR